MATVDPVRIFVSYKKDDEVGDGRGRSFVRSLKRAIEDAARTNGAVVPEVWYDDEIESGASWRREIQRHIESAEVLVLVYTPEFFAPDGYIVRDELPAALKRLQDLQVIQIVRRPVQAGTGFFSTPSIPKVLRDLDPEQDGHPFDGLDAEDLALWLSETADHVLAAAGRAHALRQATHVRPILEEYLDKLSRRRARRDRSNAEDQLKTPIQNCLDALSPLLSGRPLVTRTEDPLDGDDVVSHVRLDIAVLDERSGYRIGHVELKAPDKGADPTKPRGQGNWTNHDREQWSKLKEHPNLLYCNGWEWTLIREGVRVGHVDLDDYSSARISDDAVRRFSKIVADFVSWRPLAPRSASALAARLAPLARILRDAVSFEMTKASNSHDPSRSKLVQLHRTWQQTLMPDATGEDFADSVAQTFTYALLLARLNDRITLPLDSDDVAKSLRVHGHVLLGSVLDLLADQEVRAPLDEQIGLVETAIAAVDPIKLRSKKDTWLYFYEDFLAEYDPQRRKDAGVYYTPVEVVGAQVRLTDFALKDRFERPYGLGDRDVKVLDPATGTGTYLLSVAEHVLQEAQTFGLHSQAVAESLQRRLFGFELLIGAYSVAHLRLTKELTDAGADLGSSGVHVYLTDTLTAPREGHGTLAQPPLFWGSTQQAIIAEQRESDAIKSDQEKITVVLGNPPYNRTNREAGQGAGGAETRNMVLSGSEGRPPLINDFRDPVIRAGHGRALKHNLNDPYVYFMRWAIWKACEQDATDPAIVSFITNSSYLRSIPFRGLREHMRRQFDEVWIIDLGGGGRGARKEENVFAIQTAVAIFIGIQRPLPKATKQAAARRTKKPAEVWYRRIEGSRQEKLAALEALSDLRVDDASWTAVSDNNLTDFGARFVPSGQSDFWGWPTLHKLFPWAHSGAQFTRTWPIAPDKETLRARWDDLFVSGQPDATKFKEGRDRKVDSKKTDVLSGAALPPLTSESAVTSLLEPVRYGFRSFDRMWCLPDARLGDYLRVPLWRTSGPDQLFFTSLASTPLGVGPALTVSAHVPDLHHFRGSYGTKDVVPAWRDAAATEANVNQALIRLLSQKYSSVVKADDLFDYVFGLLGTAAFTERYYTDLGESEARIPITASYSLFKEVAAFGRTLIAVETYGARHREALPGVMAGSARIDRSPSLGEYPEDFSYEMTSQTLRVGNGYVSGVAPDVWAFEVSGLRVVASWLGYRMALKSGLSGPLDAIQPVRWAFDEELLELLWAVEHISRAAEQGSALLDRVIGGEILSDSAIPAPSAAEAAAPVEQENVLFDGLLGEVDEDE